MKAHMAGHVHKLSDEVLTDQTKESVAIYDILENLMCDDYSLHLDSLDGRRLLRRTSLEIFPRLRARTRKFCTSLPKMRYAPNLALGAHDFMVLRCHDNAHSKPRGIGTLAQLCE